VPARTRLGETPHTPDLRERILRVMDRKMHRAWPVLSGPDATRGQLRVHYRQEWAVYVRDFPVFLSRVHARCPVMEVRRGLAENLYEEETGGLSGQGPHPELFLELMEALGFPRGDFEDVDLLPEAAAYRAWLDRATTRLPWPVSLGVATIFVEGSVHERRETADPPPPPEDPEAEVRGHFLVRHQGVDPGRLRLIRAHRTVERSHRASAWRMVLASVTGSRREDALVRVMERTLRSWLSYRDAVARAAGI